MLPYYILVFLPLLPLGIFSRRQKRLTNHQIAMLWFLVILLTMLMLRAPTVGRDLANYKIMFKTFSRMRFVRLFSVSTDKGYVILNRVISHITKDFQWLLIITSILSVLPLAYTYISETEDYPLTIALYLSMPTFILLFSGLRQSLAISMGMIAFEFTKRRKPFFFIIFVVLAMTFHRSAFMLFLMYPLYHLRLKKQWLLGVIPAMLIIFVFNRQIFSFMSRFISDFYSNEITTTGAYTMMFLFIAYAVMCFVIPDESLIDDGTRGLRNFLLFSVMMQMFAPLHSLAMRMNYYYIVFIPLLIPKILNRTSVRWRQIALIAKYVLIIYFVLNFFISSVNKNSLDTFPYHFFWEKSL